MRDRTGRTAALAALALSLAGTAGCGVTLPWWSGSAPDAPARFTAQPAGPDGVFLSWDPQPGIDGYELQARVDAAPWGPPPGYRSGPTVWFAQLGDVPELGTLTFRLRAVAGSHTSGWVEAGIVRPLSPPEVSAEVTTWGITAVGPVTVRWTNGSLVATDVSVERGPGAGLGPWTALPATLGAGSLVDHDLQDGASYAYRVRVGKGGSWSEPRTAYAGPIALAAPWGLEALRVASGVALTWHAQSTTATTTTVQREDDGFWSVPPGGQLPGAPSSYLDPAPSVWPATRYQITVTNGSVWAYGDPAALPPFTLAGPPALAASAVELPSATYVARTPGGGFLLLDTSAWAGAQVYRPTASGYDAHTIAVDPYAQPAYLSPGIAADPAGAPHVVYARTDMSTGSRDLLHEAWTGTGWDVDVVQTDTPVWSGSGAVFALGAAGALHVAYLGAQTADSRPVVHLLREGGVTTATSIDPEPTTSFVTLSIAMQAGGDGTVVLAREGYAYTAEGSPIELSTRTPAGDWSLDPVPIGSTPVTGFAIAAGAGGDVVVAYARPSSSGEDLWTIRRTAGVWSASERAASGPWGSSQGLALAATPDLSRLALLFQPSYTSWLAATGTSGWGAVQVGPTARAGWVGFDASGLWALYRNDSYSVGSPIRYSLFVDAP